MNAQLAYVFTIDTVFFRTVMKGLLKFSLRNIKKE